MSFLVTNAGEIFFKKKGWPSLTGRLLPDPVVGVY